MRKMLVYTMFFVCLMFMSSHVMALDDDLLKLQKSNIESELQLMQLDFQVKTMKYLNGTREEMYILGELSPSGYLIYDIEFQIILEMNLETDPPYEDIREELYYFGYGKYSFDPNNIDMFSTMESEERKLIENNIKLENENSSDIAGTKTLSGDVMIIKDYYFEDLETNFPNNVGGSCGYVALSILMGYLDQNYDDDLVPIEYENHDVVYEPIGTNQDFHDLLIVLDGRDPTSGSLATTAYNTHNASFEYISQNYNINASNYHITSVYLPLAYEVRDEIDDNLPCLLFGHYYSPDWNNHAVVAYGYNGSMFIVHSGYKGTGDSRVYLSSYLLGSYMKIKYTFSAC
jgi:hypothetical protein